MANEQAATGGPPIAPVEEAPEIAQLLHRHFLSAVLGETTLEESLEELDRQINDLMESS